MSCIYSKIRFENLQEMLRAHPLCRKDMRLFMFDKEVPEYTNLFADDGPVKVVITRNALKRATMIQMSDEVVEADLKTYNYLTNELLFLTEYYKEVLINIYKMILVFRGEEEEFCENADTIKLD